MMLELTDAGFKRLLRKKMRGVRAALADRKTDAAVIQRRDNFAWLTTGGVNAVSINDSIGVSAFVITPDNAYLIAQSMDAARQYAEELREAPDVTLVSLPCFGQGIVYAVGDILKGKTAVSDTPMGAAQMDNNFFWSMHGPLEEIEIARYTVLGEIAEQVVLRTMDDAAPGMTELQLYHRLAMYCAEAGIGNAVNLLGSDKRVSMYRHCVATNKIIERYALIACAFKKWGLTAPLSRALYLTDALPPELSRRHRVACEVSATAIAMCKPQALYADIYARQKAVLAGTEFSEEWKEHFMGGITGYIVNDSSRCLDPLACIGRNQVFNWYSTVNGAKVEETTLALDGGVRMPTNTGLFPQTTVVIDNQTISVPGILLR